MRNASRMTWIALAGAVATVWFAPAALAEKTQWQHVTEIPRMKRGKVRKPAKAHLWIPPGVENVRGIFIGQKIVIEKKLANSPAIREACADSKLAIIYIEPGFDGIFNVQKDSHKKLLKMLSELAEKSGHPELTRAPMLTMGHSTAGIFARNIAYWKPERVIGIIHIKSGNLHQHVYTENKSIAGVPFVAINGEFEQFGPEGGIRKEYGRQTQWIMIRKQILDRRAKDPDYLMSLVVHPGGDHTSWNKELTEYCAAFIRSAVAKRVPKDWPAGDEPVACVKLSAEDGWLTDADIKDPDHAPAPYAKYTGDKAKAFWHLDETMAKATRQIHKDAFDKPDPSGDNPPKSLEVWKQGR